jgi:hypothetical protein
VTPGDHKEVGDHFLALFPATSVDGPAVLTTAPPVPDSDRDAAARVPVSDVAKGAEGRSQRGGRHWLSRLLPRTAHPAMAMDAAGIARGLPHPTAAQACKLSRCPEIARDATFRVWMEPIITSSSRENAALVGSLGKDERHGALWGSLRLCAEWLGKLGLPRMES